MRWNAAGLSGDLGSLQSLSLAESADSHTIVIKYSLVSGSGVGDVLRIPAIHPSGGPWSYVYIKLLEIVGEIVKGGHGVGSSGQ